VIAEVRANVELLASNFKANIFWGDGTSSPAVLSPNKSGIIRIAGTHAYAQPGLYAATVQITDLKDGIHEVVQATGTAVAPPGPFTVSLAYYDDEHPNALLPNPWNGSPNTTFWGGTTDGLFDTGAILIRNTGLKPIVIGPGLSVDHFASGAVYQLWDSFIGSGFTLMPGQSVIAAQTAGRDFDTSDTPIVNDPSQRNTSIPLIHITVNGKAYVYQDVAQVLNAGGFDPGQSEGVSESAPWQLVGLDPLVSAAEAQTTVGPSAASVSFANALATTSPAPVDLGALDSATPSSRVPSSARVVVKFGAVPTPPLRAIQLGTTPAASRRPIVEDPKAFKDLVTGLLDT
jgi:hypothetical protein